MEVMAEPAEAPAPITLKDVKANPEVKNLIAGANDVMMSMG